MLTTRKYEKILTISDNPSLTRFFQEECKQQKVTAAADIKYNYSMTNQNPSAMIAIGATPIDLKNQQCVNFIKKEYDLIFSLHCRQIFPPDLVNSVMCINVHPGFNPCNRGWYPHVFSIINGKPAGATIHLMDRNIDHGEIIDQAMVEIKMSDTSLEVYKKIIAAEKALIKNNLLKIINSDFAAKTPSSEQNYNSIEDFKALCKLDLDTIASLGDHINLLRALSHGECRNAYFIDKEGKKVFVQIILSENT